MHKNLEFVRKKNSENIEKSLRGGVVFDPPIVNRVKAHFGQVIIIGSLIPPWENAQKCRFSHEKHEKS